MASRANLPRQGKVENWLTKRVVTRWAFFGVWSLMILFMTTTLESTHHSPLLTGVGFVFAVVGFAFGIYGVVYTLGRKDKQPN
jgi:hypothetical protein